MASLIQWTWDWESSGRCWRTGKPGMLQSVGLQRVRHDWQTEKQHTFQFLILAFQLLLKKSHITFHLYLTLNQKRFLLQLDWSLSDFAHSCLHIFSYAILPFWYALSIVFCLFKPGHCSRLNWILLSFSSVIQLCLTLCNPMDCSTLGLPVHHQLSDFTQTHVHWVSDAIQPSHPLSSPSPPAFNISQHQGLFKWVSSSYQVAKVLEFQLQHQSFQWIFRTDFL